MNKKSLFLLFSGLFLLGGCQAELEGPHFKMNKNNVEIHVLNAKYNEHPEMVVEKHKILPAWKSIKIKKNAIFVVGKYPILKTNKYDTTLLLAVKDAKLKLALYEAKLLYPKIKSRIKKNDLNIKTIIYNSVLYDVPVNYDTTTCLKNICYVKIVVNRDLMRHIIYNNLKAEYPQYIKVFNNILFNF